MRKVKRSKWPYTSRDHAIAAVTMLRMRYWPQLKDKSDAQVARMALRVVNRHKGGGGMGNVAQWGWTGNT